MTTRKATPKKRSVVKRRETWRLQYDLPHERRNVHGDKHGVLDEVVLRDGDKRVFHVERMDRKSWWVGIGDGVSLWVSCDKSGKYVVTGHEGLGTKAVARGGP